MEAQPQRRRGHHGHVALIALAAALSAAALRAALLLDDPWAHGYDGWYYVLQVRALLDGAPLFADRSLVFAPLTALAALTGDAILGNKLAAIGFAAITAAAGAVAGWRWSGSRTAAAAAGMWWALSPLHLSLTAEFLKNSAGMAVLALLLAALPRCERHRRTLAVVMGLALLGPLVHKLTGVLGLLAAGGYATAQVTRGHTIPRWLWITAGVGVAAVMAAGLLRPADLARLLGSDGGTTTRIAAFWSRRLIFPERIALVAIHLAPLAVAVLAWRPRHRPLALTLLPLSIAALGPGLSFGWDGLAWRLMLMGFVAAGIAYSVIAPRVTAAIVVVVGVGQAPVLVSALQARSPDYVAWATAIPVIQGTIPAGDRVIAHRGLCGFVWAEADIICENFQPPTPHERWWRIAYGFGPHRFEPYVQDGEPAPVSARPGYTIVWEPHWQQFLDAEGETFLLARDPRNPFRVRPTFVYGPGEETPSVER